MIRQLVAGCWTQGGYRWASAGPRSLDARSSIWQSVRFHLRTRSSGCRVYLKKTRRRRREAASRYGRSHATEMTAATPAWCITFGSTGAGQSDFNGVPSLRLTTQKWDCSPSCVVMVKSGSSTSPSQVLQRQTMVSTNLARPFSKKETKEIPGLACLC